MKKITILVPAYNESESLPVLHHALVDLFEGKADTDVFAAQDYQWDILIVDDGSSDDTSGVLAELRNSDQRVTYLTLSRNFGKENAMLAGLDNATGDAVIIMDADLQDPVEVIPEMVSYWNEGYDDVCGRRRSRGRESWVKRRLSLAYYDILRRSAHIDMMPNVGDFRLLDRRCVDALRELRETNRYSKGLFCYIGFSKKQVDFDRADRHTGHSSFNLRRLFSLAMEGITGFTTAPLRFASIMGIIVSFTAFVYLFFILFKTIFWGEPVRGYPTIMCVILFLGGCQLLALGIIGEYVGRIFNETKRRPPYIIDRRNGEKV